MVRVQFSGSRAQDGRQSTSWSSSSCQRPREAVSKRRRPLWAPGDAIATGRRTGSPHYRSRSTYRRGRALQPNAAAVVTGAGLVAVATVAGDAAAAAAVAGV